MARDKIGSEVMQVRFPDGTFDRIDAAASNRSEFVRDAVAGALADMEVPLGIGGSGGGERAGDAVPYLTGPPKKNSIARADPEHVDDDGSETSFNKPKRSKKADPAVAAVKAAVAGIEPSAPVRRVSSVPSPRAQDILDVVAVIRSGRYSSNMAARALGWPGLRYANAEKALLASGKVVVEGGVLVAKDE